MIDAMKVNEQAANKMLSPSRVVQLPSGELDLEDVACVAFLAVATAWKVYRRLVMPKGKPLSLHTPMLHAVLCKKYCVVKYYDSDGVTHVPG